MKALTPNPPLTAPASAIVLGGGCAGIAAALRLAEAGVDVTLIEARTQLGGRATSFTDPATADLVDNCPHVITRCYTNLLDLLDRMGVRDRIEWHRALHFMDGAGDVDTLVADGMPAPLHLARSLLAMRSLTWREKLAIGRAMLAMLQLGEDRHELGNMTFEEWLQELEQPPSAIEKFWSVLVVSACNETLDHVAASYAIQFFQESFLATDNAYEVGLPRVPLRELYDPAEEAIERAGGRVRLGVSAQKFEFDGSRIVGVRTDDAEKSVADAYVAALPFERLGRLCTDLMFASDHRLSRLDDLGVSPIIGVHLVLKREDGEPAMSLPHAMLTRGWMQRVIRKSHSAEGGTYLHGVFNAAHEWIDRSADHIVATAIYELRRHLPEAVDARVVYARVVKERGATFSARAGVERVRPRTTGPIGNLYLAGDWCDTGWPATLEGAVRSGYRAAEAVLNHLRPQHAPHELRVPDLTPTRLYGFLTG